MRITKPWMFLLLLAVSGAGLIPASHALAGDPASLRAEYRFDTVDAGSVADLTGLGHTLTLNGAWSVTDGVASPAVAFSTPSLATSLNSGDLNPGTLDFATTAVFRLPSSIASAPDTPNLLQKGLFADRGQWKMQLKQRPASVQCRIKGTLAARLITSTVTGVDNGAWHTATCWRSGSTIGVTVDGVVTQLSVDVGDVTNTRPFQIGAKSLTATSDQFPGVVDYVSVAAGDGAAAVSAAASRQP